MESQFSPGVDHMKEFHISFSSSEAAYHAGTCLQGIVTMVFREAMQVGSVRVQCFGKGKVQWFDSSATGDGADPVYRGREVYMDNELVLYESNSQHGDLLAKGPHTYDFEFALPADLPSSFEGEYGYVRYVCCAHVYKPGSTLPDYTYRRIISVSRLLDLNNEPSEIRSTVEGEEIRPVSCCCLISGQIAVRFHMDRRAYVPGEDLRWKAEVRQDLSMSIIKCCSVTLKQFVDYTGISDAFFSAGRAKPHFQTISVCAVHHPGSRQGEPIIWEGHMAVPPLPPSRLDGCKVISIAYALHFKAVVTFGSDITLMANLVIGTIPMVNHFRPPPYTSSDSAGSGSASLVPLLPPAVNWNIPTPVFEECHVKVSQKRLPDVEEELGENCAKFIPLYPVYRNQPIFVGTRENSKTLL